VRNGAAILHPGDHVTPQELSNLTFWPEAGFTGPAGSLRYTVDNGHGGIVEGSTDVMVGATATSAESSSDTALWDGLRGSTDPRDFTAFLRLFPTSRYAEDAKHRRMELEAATNNAVAAKPDAGKAQGNVAPSPREKLAVVAGAEPRTVPADVQPRPVPADVQPRPVPADVQPRPVPADDPHPAASVVTAANGPLIAAPASPARGQSGDANHFQDCPTCPRMVRIPAGAFMMGQGAHEPESMPAHRVEVRAFAIGQTPVTVAEWKACIAAKGCSFLPRMRVADDRTPVHNLSWEDIGQYMTWVSVSTGHAYRLPSEAEWEYAARGGTTTRYWWGDSVGMSLANCNDCGGVQDEYGPLRVDALPPNPFGLYDMLGGVAQWMADCWFPNYRGAPADAAPRQAKTCEKRVLRGGSFRAGHDEITVTYRGNYDAPVRYLVNGFRVARDLE
jgi:formylglycine-generating enzyme required for sulfatase activity